MDKVSEMLTKIRNAQMAGHKEVEIKFSKFKFALAEILRKEGFIETVSKSNEGFGVIKIGLKYFKISNTENEPAIRGLKKVSKCGQRIYVKGKEIKSVKNNFGIAILSTSKGVMTGEEARNMKLGGEYICEIW